MLCMRHRWNKSGLYGGPITSADSRITCIYIPILCTVFWIILIVHGYRALQTHSPPPAQGEAWVQVLWFWSAGPAPGLGPASPPHTPPAQPVSCLCWSQTLPGSYCEEGGFFLPSLNHCPTHSRTRGCVCAPAASGSVCTSASPHNTCCRSPIWGLWISSYTPSGFSWSPSCPFGACLKCNAIVS